MRRLTFLLTLSLAAVVGAFGATVSTAQDAATPSLQVSDGDLVWNDVAIGTSVTKTLTVTNVGGGTLPLGAPTIVAGDAKDFAVAGSACTGASLPTGGACTITVKFTPQASSTRVSHLRVPTTLAGCTSFVTLAGSGAATTAASHPDRHVGFRTPCTSATPAAAPTVVNTTIVQQGGAVLGTSSSGKPVCGSKRLVRIHIKPGRGEAFKRGTMTVKTKGRSFTPKYYSKGKRKGQYYSDLSFKGLKVGRYEIKIKATLASGKTFKRTRHFVTCISGKTPK